MPAVEPAPTRRDSRAGIPRRPLKTKIKNSSRRTSRPGRHTREGLRLTLNRWLMAYALALSCGRTVIRQ
jgi:hypothetical protein